MTVKLSEIEKAAEGATPGPWAEVASIAALTGRRYNALEGQNELDVCEIPWTPQGSADSAFIAASRTAIPALTAALRDVLALHRPTTERSRPCGECGDFHPCATVRAITAHVDPT